MKAWRRLRVLVCAIAGLIPLLAHGETCTQPGSFVISLQKYSTGPAMNENDTIVILTGQLVGNLIKKLIFSVDSQDISVDTPSSTTSDHQFTFSVKLGDAAAAVVSGASSGQLTLKEAHTSTLQVKAYDSSNNCGATFVDYVATTSKKDYAIVVGVNSVPAAGGRKLKYAHDDAIGIANHLISNLQFDPTHIYLLMDGNDSVKEPFPDRVNYKPVQLPSDIDVVFTEIGGKVNPGAQVFFYFSGHQMIDVNGDEDTYFMMLPGSQLTPGSDRSRYAWQYLVHDFGRIKGAHGVVIIDACYSGASGTTVAFSDGTSNTSASTGAPSDLGGKWLVAPFLGKLPPKQPLPTYVWENVESSDSGPSWEFDSLKHGVFTYYLLKAGEEAAKHHQALTLFKAFGPDDGDMGVLYYVQNFTDTDNTGKTFSPGQKPVLGFSVNEAIGKVQWVR